MAFASGGGWGAAPVVSRDHGAAACGSPPPPAPCPPARVHISPPTAQPPAVSLRPLPVGRPTCWFLTVPSVLSNPTRSRPGSFSRLTHLPRCLAGLPPGSDFQAQTWAFPAQACRSPPLSPCLLTRGFAAIWRILPPASGWNVPVSCLLHLLRSPTVRSQRNFLPLSQFTILKVKAVGRAPIQNQGTRRVL